MSKRLSAILLFLIGATAVLGTALWQFDGKDAEDGGTLPASVVHWQELIRDLGPTSAYARFKEDNVADDQAHRNAHRFGAALYHEEGVDGIRVCDAAFAYGCYHEFIGTAIRQEGDAVIPLLNTACRSVAGSFLACQHGIGHGVLSIAGYDKNALIQTLDTCTALPGADPIGGCIGGVFMEYNLRTMLSTDSDGDILRPLPLGNPLEPCDSLASGDYRKACYYWQPQLWIQTAVRAGTSHESLIVLLDKRCGMPTTSAEHQRCIEGIGNTVVQLARWQPKQTANLCDLLTAQDDANMCMTAAAAAFSGNPTYAGRAPAMCHLLPQEFAEICLEKIASPQR